MSRGLPGDLALTRKQMKQPVKPTGKRNWLRHTLGSQAALLDELLLQGGYTINQMAHQISPLSVRNKGNIPILEFRVRQHLAHLQEEWNGPMAPHQLKLRENSAGQWSFA